MTKQSVTLNPERVRHAATVVDEGVRSDDYPNAVLAVGDHERTLWTHVAPGEDGVTLDSIFPLASITKPVTAIAIMQLVERGLLLLNEPVKTFIPEFAQNGKERVTVWNLLTHTSGMAEDNERINRLFEARAPRLAYLQVALEATLQFEPGTQHSYCNVAFLVLDELITRLSGQPYADYLHDNIFAPLGMNSTAFVPTDPSRAAPVHNFGGPDEQAYWGTLAAPHAGLWSSAEDLLILGRAFLNDGRVGTTLLLSLAAVEAMTHLQTAGINSIVEGRPQPAFVALGWGKHSMRGVLLPSERSYGHTGATGTMLWIDPVWDLSFVFLSSRWDANNNLNMRALNAVYGALEHAD